jgi:hypothetical protein
MGAAVTYFEKGNVFGLIVAFITFVSSWIYCIANYGFLFGVGLGWLPSIIVAGLAYLLAALLWGPLALILAIILGYIFLQMVR